MRLFLVLVVLNIPEMRGLAPAVATRKLRRNPSPQRHIA
jgi:hypothetical protein